MKNPDFGQGIGDLAQQIQMMLMMKKLMPQQGGKFGAGATGAPGQSAGGSIGAATGQSPTSPSSYGADPRQQMGQPTNQTPGGQNPLSGLDPQMLMMIMQMIQKLKGGGMGQMGGGMPGGMMGGGPQMG